MSADVVTRGKVQAVALVTIGQEHPAWEDPLQLGNVKDAFVRLDPPLNWSDEDVARLKAMVRDEGALAVKVLSIRRDEVVFREDRAVPVEEAPKSARALVLELAEGANSQDRERLVTVLEGTLTRAGL
jgi:hypothetical protein